ncbi:MAG TPA: DNA recombination protein RmuC [Candidatus Polarisedimenticolaceae bacterium]
MNPLLAAAIGLVVGALAGWIWGARSAAKAREDLARADEKLRLLDEAGARLKESFAALSHEALRQNQQSFLDLARSQFGALQDASRNDLSERQKAIEAIVKPVAESLQQVDRKLQEVEKERAGAYAGLIEQVKGLAETQTRLQSETAGLSKALRAPISRGKWGEMQLRRVVELAGMLDRCDFVEQPTLSDEQGKTLRPDMLVHLPGGKSVVVDAKAPLAAYLDAAETADENAREARLRDHARLVRDHITALSNRNYSRQVEPAPEFVVMFLPGESFFGAALQFDGTLLEYGIERGVIPASPTTLIALLRAVGYGWRHEQLAENAKEISDLGRQLHERLRTMTGHFDKLGRSLDAATAAFNQAVASLDTRVLVSARRFEELGAAEGATLETPDAVERQARLPSRPEAEGDEAAH